MGEVAISDVNVGAVSLRVEDRGNGPAVIFVHGYTTSGRFWRPQAESLAGDFRTITFDLRGHGRSGKPMDVEYTIEAFTDDLLVIMDKLDIKSAVMAGLSMGGAIVLRAALQHPGKVRGLILADTTANGVGKAVDPNHVVQRIRSIGVEAASEEVIEASFARSTDRKLVEWAKQEVVVVPQHVAEQAIMSLGAFDVEKELKTIRCPCLVLVGEEDRITPIQFAEALKTGIPNAMLKSIPGAAHFPMLEQPDLVNRIIRDFLYSF